MVWDGQTKVKMKSSGNETGEKARSRANGQKQRQIGNQRGRLQKQHGQQHLSQIMGRAARHSEAEKADTGDFSQPHHQSKAAKPTGQRIEHGKGTAEKKPAEQQLACHERQRHAAAQPVQRKH